MTIWRAIDGAATEPRAEPSVVTIGVFDGVHRGHQALLARARDAGQGLPVVAVTFDPHPLEVVRPEVCPQALTTCARRVDLLAAHADEVRVLAFDAAMQQWTPEEFVQRVLIDQLRASVVVVGENFRFGHKNAGDVDALRGHGFDVVPVELAGDGAAYSSSRVRELIAEGRVRGAAEILGRPHDVVGVVVEGDKRGRDLGFPTANVPVASGFAVPADGVYACWLVVEGERHPAATSVGTNPTFGENARRVESFVIDHAADDLDLYDQQVRVEFVEHLRPMEKFDTIDALVAQMHDDVSDARGVLAN